MTHNSWLPEKKPLTNAYKCPKWVSSHSKIINNVKKENNLWQSFSFIYCYFKIQRILAGLG
jgi:hypothetical protein